MSKPGVTRISISLPPDLLEDFDQVTSTIGYDRSKAIQQAMRDFISEYHWEQDSTASAVGTITIIYDHDIPGLEAELTRIQHLHTTLISSTTHIHLDTHHCLLVIVVKGKTAKIKELATQLQSLRGIHQVKVTSMKEETSSKHQHSH
ncbi:MAG: nickel-responsive transcriptional regulator NikR [Candidatus Hermodarchaeia archaeon]|jgi:CopG family nickel-responsive transcriptional regulator